MGEETTQLDLTDELDRLEAIRGEADADDDLRLVVHDAVVDPDGVTGRRLAGTTVEGPASLRGRRWEHPLDALHRDHVTAHRGEAELSVAELVDAVGGPDLSGPYVLDRESYVVGVVTGADRDPVELRVVEAPAASDRSVDETVELGGTALETATVAGYADRRRYRVFDAYGRPTTLEG